MKNTLFNIGVILGLIAVMFLMGFIFMAFWNWLMPLFWETAPVLNIWHGVGIVLFMRFFGIMLGLNDKTS